MCGGSSLPVTGHFYEAYNYNFYEAYNYNFLYKATLSWYNTTGWMH